MLREVTSVPLLLFQGNARPLTTVIPERVITCVRTSVLVRLDSTEPQRTASIVRHLIDFILMGKIKQNVTSLRVSAFARACVYAFMRAFSI